MDNRHLNYLVESIFVNVGEPYENVKGSSHPMSHMEVGGVIVVGGVTTTLGDGSTVSQGEGRQEVDVSVEYRLVAKCSEFCTNLKYRLATEGNQDGRKARRNAFEFSGDLCGCGCRSVRNDFVRHG